MPQAKRVAHLVRDDVDQSSLDKRLGVDVGVAARRQTDGQALERLLGGGKAATAATSSSTKDGTSSGGGGAGGLPGAGSAATLTSTVEAVLHSNPPKIVRRWLGTSSGAAKDAALTDVVGAADALLDPAGAAGRSGRPAALSSM